MSWLNEIATLNTGKYPAKKREEGLPERRTSLRHLNANTTKGFNAIDMDDDHDASSAYEFDGSEVLEGSPTKKSSEDAKQTEKAKTAAKAAAKKAAKAAEDLTLLQSTADTARLEAEAAELKTEIARLRAAAAAGSGSAKQTEKAKTAAKAAAKAATAAENMTLLQATADTERLEAEAVELKTEIARLRAAAAAAGSGSADFQPQSSLTGANKKEKAASKTNTAAALNLKLLQETADTARQQLEAELKTETIRLQGLRAAAQSALEKALIEQAQAEAEAGKTENAREASIGVSVAVSSKRKLDMARETALNCNLDTAKDSMRANEDASTSTLESLLRAKKSRQEHNAKEEHRDSWKSSDRLDAFLVYQARQTFNIQKAINSQNMQRLRDQHEKEYIRFLRR